jgi:hypothetical protein
MVQEIMFPCFGFPRVVFSGEDSQLVGVNHRVAIPYHPNNERQGERMEEQNHPRHPEHIEYP